MKRKLSRDEFVERWLADQQLRKVERMRGRQAAYSVRQEGVLKALRGRRRK